MVPHKPLTLAVYRQLFCKQSLSCRCHRGGYATSSIVPSLAHLRDGAYSNLQSRRRYSPEAIAFHHGVSEKTETQHTKSLWHTTRRDSRWIVHSSHMPLYSLAIHRRHSAVIKAALLVSPAERSDGAACWTGALVVLDRSKGGQAARQHTAHGSGRSASSLVDGNMKQFEAPFLCLRPRVRDGR
ncbi:hypothetical protein K456DRAFT_57908 [Colletotrichum gloeosporioides 23]|nr:hypothetical protein K456DRAFT_57908 [Colletotrichum gloeosporioides 23]